MCKILLEEGARLEIYDPKVERDQILADLTHPSVTNNPELVRSVVKINEDPYTAVAGTHAIVVCTEWDEFEVIMPGTSCKVLLSNRNCFFFQKLDYQRIYKSMMKPAYIFDGRKILDHDRLQQIGFHVQTIGKRLNRVGLLRSWGNIPQLN